ncbi:hypothetical protein [Gaoshiqia sediminis]|uniref:Uncharacterized protein n=1 Tax=Gaoshiqia sediminis TaxID=2986998 RepID=A0AA41YAA4_9BACT|nr:hypothetical protein [Gaoshiqia sediminis]MCW0482170.1 hypothetical protein [Gaoshiqia sediminis]
MKLFILSSSIFYLLGLKMTHNIEMNQKMDMDTVRISIPAEQKLMQPDDTSKLILEPGKDEKAPQSTSGSNPLTAPKPVHPIDKIE